MGHIYTCDACGNKLSVGTVTIKTDNISNKEFAQLMGDDDLCKQTKDLCSDCAIKIAKAYHSIAEENKNKIRCERCGDVTDRANGIVMHKLGSRGLRKQKDICLNF